MYDPSHKTEPCVLLVGSEGSEAVALRDSIPPRFPVLVARRASEALQLLDDHASDVGLIAVDPDAGEMTGEALLDRVCSRYPHLERVLVSREDSPRTSPQSSGIRLVVCPRGAFIPEPRTRIVTELIERAELRRAVERSRRELQRFAQDAIFGYLSAGIGHEVNNPASVLKINLGMLQEYIADLASLVDPHEGVLREDLEELVSGAGQTLGDCASAVDTLEHIARDLRVLGVKPGTPAAAAPVDPNVAVARALRLLARQAGYRARVVQELGEVPLVMADERGLAQVVVSLLTDAMRSVEALGNPGDRRIRIATASDANGVTVQVQDTGPAVPARQAAQADPEQPPESSQDPCRQLVETWGGELSTRFVSGAGTTRTVRLRSVVTPPEELESPATGLPLAGTVLVVDDDPLVLRAIQRSLGRSYRVVTASSGEEAWKQLEGREFDAVLCDVHMPLPDGPELLRRLREHGRRERAHVAFMTAGTSTGDARRFEAEAERWGIPLLHKPLTVQQVRRAVAVLISRPG